MRLLRAFVVLCGIGLLLGAFVVGERHERTTAANDLRVALERQAADGASALETYFERARAINLLAAESPPFREFYELGGDRSAHVIAAAGPARAVLGEAERALAFLHELYPGSIGEACFIDASGAENARIVSGHAAPHDELTADETSTVFFAPALRLPRGEVYQSEPYFSEDTKQWVIANAAPVYGRSSTPHGLVHFEIALEGLRGDLARLGGELQILDPGTRRVVIDSSAPVTRTFARFDPALAATLTSRAGLTVEDGVYTGFQRVSAGQNNANRWYVAVSAPEPDVALLGWIDWATAPLALGSLFVLGLAWVGFGKYEARQREERRATVDRLAALAENVSDLVTVVQPNGTISVVVGPTEAALGLTRQSLVGRQLLDLIHEDDRESAAAFLRRAVARNVGDGRSGTWRMRTADGRWGVFETTARNLVAQEGIEGLVLTTHDITQRQEFEDQLRHRAFHDPLTQLANRALFYDRVEHALSNARRSGHVAAVLFLDLDDFKVINDSYGHASGDEMLVAFAQRLRGCLRSADTAARLGGDEFGVLVEGVGAVSEAVNVAERILGAMREPFTLHELPIELRPSIGIAESESVVGGVDEVLRAADLAMYSSKRRGKGRFELYSADLEEALTPRDHDDPRLGAGWFVRNEEQRAEVMSLLDREDAIRPHFQPVLDLRTGLLAGYEALARFDLPGHRPPNAWFAQAHRFGLGTALEADALRAALAVPNRPQPTTLWLNVSPSALMSPDVARVLPESLDGLVFELTENELVAGAGPLEESLLQLRRRGALIAIDDAGTGYAGLRQLMRLRPDLVKLDRSLIHGVSTDATKAALIESLVRYATKIGGDVCAEGVERLDDLVLLSELNVAYAQGFAVAVPAPPWSSIAPAAVGACQRAVQAALRGSAGLSNAEVQAERRLERIAERLNAVDTAEGLEAAMIWVAAEVNARKCSISWFDRLSQTLETVAAPDRGANATVFPVTDYPLTAHVLRTSEMAQVLADDPDADPREVAILREEGSRALLMVPVLSGSETVGLMEVYATAARPWGRDEMSNARVIASLLGPVLERVAGRDRASVRA